MIALVAVAALMYIPGAGATHPDTPTEHITGCVDISGKGRGAVRKLASGDEPLKSCSSGEREVHLDAGLETLPSGRTTLSTTSSAGPQPSLAIGSDGLPVISWVDTANDDVVVTHCGNDACTVGNTTNVLDENGTLARSTSITIGADGLPLVSYVRTGDLGANSVIKVAHCGDLACSAGNAVTAAEAGQASDPSASSLTSIIVGADGIPWLAAPDNTVGGSALGLYRCFDEVCSAYAAQGGAGDPGQNTGQFVSLTIGSDGFPVAAFRHGLGFLQVLHCSDAACDSNTVNGPDVTTVTGHASIAIGTDGYPMISYQGGTQDLKAVHCTSVTCATFTAPVTLDATGNAGVGSSITIGPDGRPVIAYIADGALKVIRCGSEICSGSTNSKTTLTIPSAVVGGVTSVAIGSDGYPVVAYWEDIVEQVKVAHCKNRFCFTGHRPR